MYILFVTHFKDTFKKVQIRINCIYNDNGYNVHIGHILHCSYQCSPKNLTWLNNLAGRMNAECEFEQIF